MTILCLASYEKGHEFLRQCKRQGWTIVLLTSESLRHSAGWPMESVDQIFYMPDGNHHWDRAHTVNTVSYLARTRMFDRIVALDDFDVEVAAMLREHLRVPGMGETTAHYFRDKLAMRMKATEAGLDVPDFIHMLNHAQVAAFLERVPGPWVLKPRSMAGAIGIKKDSPRGRTVADRRLGDEQSRKMLERFVPGDIFTSIPLCMSASGVCDRERLRPPPRRSRTRRYLHPRILERTRLGAAGTPSPKMSAPWQRSVAGECRTANTSSARMARCTGNVGRVGGRTSRSWWSGDRINLWAEGRR
jgi:hypothetical protein